MSAENRQLPLQPPGQGRIRLPTRLDLGPHSLSPQRPTYPGRRKAHRHPDTPGVSGSLRPLLPLVHAPHGPD